MILETYMWTSLFMWTDHHAGTGQWAAGVVAFIALGFAVWIGFVQNSINKKLANIESSTEVFGYLAYNGSTPVFLRITNVGKLQVYLTQYSIERVTTAIPFALIPAGQQQNAWYDVPLPENPAATINFSLSLTDQLGRTWTSRMTVQRIPKGWIAHTHKIEKA